MLKKLLFLFQWNTLVKPWQNIDWTLLMLVIGMTVWGSLMIRSVELNQGWAEWWQHLITGLIGLALAMVIARNRYDRLLQIYWWIYGITNVGLLTVMFLGTEALGAQRWISIAGFNLQPSEFAKIGLIVTLAGLLHEKPANTIPNMFRTLGIMLVPWSLVFLEPNLGTSLVLVAITLGMLYWANTNPSWILVLLSPVISAILYNVSLPLWILWAIIIVIAAWFSLPWRIISTLCAFSINFISGQLSHFMWGVLKDYQKDRIVLFLDPDRDPLGGGYHLIQSRIAIGAGQLWGQGLNHGTQTQLNFIPEQHTDFIFAAIGEELGFAGGFFMLISFWLICLRLVFIAQGAKDNFGSLLAIGLLSMIVFQTLVNVGMTIGVAPITGIPLPWLSYGRSALLAIYIGVGLVESVTNYSQPLRFTSNKS